MSYCGWLHHVAVRGCVAASLVLQIVAVTQGFAQSNSADVHNCSQRNDSHASDSRAPRQPEFIFIAPVVVPEQKKAETGPYEPDCDQPKNAEDGNFCQTRRSAKAAEEASRAAEDGARAAWKAANVADQQLFLTYFALAGVLLTVILTFWAARATSQSAKAARDMVAEAAKASANAEATFNESRRSNEIAREGLIAQHRPWIALEVDRAGPVRISGPGSVRVNIDFTATNIGNSPAFRTIYSVKAFWTQRDWPKHDHMEALIKQTIGQQQHMSAHAPIVVPKDDTKFGFVDLAADMVNPKQNASKSKEFSLVVLCCVAYKSDLSDKWFHTVHTAYVRYKRPPGVHPRDQRRFGWSHGEIPSDDIDVSISKAGGTSSIA
jgi:hypothetical protein